MGEIIGTMTANEAQIEGTGEKVNLFDYHVKSRYNPIPIHHTRRTERDGEIPVSWILRKLSDAVCKIIRWN